MSGAQEKKGRSIVVKFSVIVALVIFVAVAVTVALAYSNVAAVVREDSLDTMRNVGSGVRREFASFIDSAYRDAEFLAANPAFVEAAARGDWRVISGYLGPWQEKQGSRLERVFVSTAVTDSVIMAEGLGAGSLGAHWRKGHEVNIDTALLGRSQMGEARLSSTSGLPVLLFTVPMMRDGKVVAIVGLSLNLRAFSEEVTDGIKIGKAGYIAVFDRRGLALAHPDAKAVLSLDLSRSEWGREAQRLESGKAIDFAEKGEEGVFLGARDDVRGFMVAAIVPRRQISAPAFAFARRIALAGLAALLVAIGLTVAYSSSVIRPLRRAAEGFRELAEGEADLTRRLEVRTGDEVGVLVSDFNTFVGRLHGIVSSLKEAQSGLASGGDDFSRSADESARSVSGMVETIGQVRERGQAQTRSVEESSSAVAQIARGIEGLDLQIEGLAASIAESSASIEQMVGNIASVTSTTERMSGQFSALASASEEGTSTLAEATRRIAEIERQSQALLEANAVIAGIASRTNLLAMNAAIEAAHAGQAGRGFSVVADEIRKLAEHAARQSRTIGTELKATQSTIAEVVGASRDTEAAFQAVAKRISETESLVREVGLAMAEQHGGSAQVLLALKEMTEISERVRSGSSEMKSGNASVLGEISRLRESARAVDEAMDRLASGASAIHGNARRSAQAADATRDMIGRMEESIGRFRV